MAYSADKSRRRSLPDIDDEGDSVPGCDSGSDTEDDSRYVFQPRDEDDAGRPEITKRRRLEEIVAGGRDGLQSPTSSCGSGGTISDGSTGAGDSPLARVSFPCPICRREFGSQKAVHGHMRVHYPHGRHQGKEEEELPLTVHGRAVSPKDEVDNSMDVVVAEPKLSVAEPAPMAFARTDLSGLKIEHGNSSAQPNPNESTAIVVAEGHPSNQVVAHPSSPPQVVVQQPAAPPPAGEQVHVRCFSCAECGKTFFTHQGLGGHVAGHKNKLREATAAAAAAAADQSDGAGAVARRDGVKPEKKHVCKVCSQVYNTGVALGGHMRKHYAGPPIMQKKKDTSLSHFLAPPGEVLAPVVVGVPELTLGLPVEEAAQPTLAPLVVQGAQPAPAPTVEVAQPESAVASSMRIFGVTIIIDSSGVKEESASNNKQAGDP